MEDAYGVDGAGTAALELLEEAARYNAWLAGKLAPFLGARNLELGAGHGTLTAILARDSRRVVALEPSRAGRAAMAARFVGQPAVEAIAADLRELAPDDRFDAVYSANVLEHIPDDVGAIADAAARLHPGGRIAAVVPAGPWLYSPFDASIGHMRRYGRADRTRLVESLRARRAGLRLVAYRTFNPVGAVGWFCSMRVAGRRAIPPAQALLFDRLVPAIRHLDHLPFPFGQSLLLAFAKEP